MEPVKDFDKKQLQVEMSQEIFLPGFDSPMTPLPVQDGETAIETLESLFAPQQPPLRVEKQRVGKWIDACKRVFPIYLATHIAFVLLTYLATLFSLKNFSQDQLGLQTLLAAWNRWDTSQFTTIATQGYDAPWRTAFFPLFPLLEAGLNFLTHNALVAGLIIANLAMLGVFMVLYQIVQEDFNGELAARAVLYLALFPTAFFLASAYNESLFLCLSLLSFYHIRRGQWWWAGLWGLLAALTRSAGVCLLLPFAYEYARQHDYKITSWLRRTSREPLVNPPALSPGGPQGVLLRARKHLAVLSGLLILVGPALFALYCALHFHDPLAFSHAQSGGDWQRQMAIPGIGFARGLWVIGHYGLLSFSSIHTVIDLSAGLLMLLLTALCFVGPWRFPRELRVYGLYGAAMFLFLILFPSSIVPLQSMSRQVIELFPAFILLAIAGKRPQFQLYYLVIAGALLSFMLLQFLVGYWIV